MDQARTLEVLALGSDCSTDVKLAVEQESVDSITLSLSRKQSMEAEALKDAMKSLIYQTNKQRSSYLSLQQKLTKENDQAIFTTSAVKDCLLNEPRINPCLIRRASTSLTTTARLPRRLSVKSPGSSAPSSPRQRNPTKTKSSCDLELKHSSASLPRIVRALTYSSTTPVDPIITLMSPTTLSKSYKRALGAALRQNSAKPIEEHNVNSEEHPEEKLEVQDLTDRRISNEEIRKQEVLLSLNQRGSSHPGPTHEVRLQTQIDSASDGGTRSCRDDSKPKSSLFQALREKLSFSK